MEQYKHTMDSRKNKHLNAFEREQIQLLLENRFSSKPLQSDLIEHPTPLGMKYIARLLLKSKRKRR